MHFLTTLLVPQRPQLHWIKIRPATKRNNNCWGGVRNDDPSSEPCAYVTGYWDWMIWSWPTTTIGNITIPPLYSPPWKHLASYTTLDPIYLSLMYHPDDLTGRCHSAQSLKGSHTVNKSSSHSSWSSHMGPAFRLLPYILSSPSLISWWHPQKKIFV